MVRTRSVDTAPGATALTENVGVDPLGCPAMDSVTLPVSPVAATETVYVAVWPRVSVADAGLADAERIDLPDLTQSLPPEARLAGGCALRNSARRGHAETAAFAVRISRPRNGFRVGTG